MGSLFEELKAREAAARLQVEGLEAELAEVSERLGAAWAGLERLRITRETVAEVLAEMTPQMPAVTADVSAPRTAHRPDPEGVLEGGDMDGLPDQDRTGQTPEVEEAGEELGSARRSTWPRTPC